MSWFISIYMASFSAWGVTTRPLPEALNEIIHRAPEYLSAQNTLRAVDLDFSSRDLLLQPQFELNAKRLNEHRLLISPVTRSRVDSLSALVSKPFSTGTTVKLAPTFERSQYLNQDPRERTNVDWQISLTQNLWQDFFGRSTRLRWAREDFERRQQLATSLLSIGQLMYDFENLYWDWAMAIRERELRTKNVARGQDLLKWTRDRYRRAAAESSDVLQAEALLTNRQLQLLTVEQNLKVLASRLQRFLPGAEWQPDPEDLAKVRSIADLPQRWTLEELSRAERIELVIARNAAGVAERRADEVREQIRPVLSVQAAYGKNGLDPDTDVAFREATSETHEYSSIGLTLSTGLDLSLENKKVESARANREAAKGKLAALEADAKVAWDQLVRTTEDLRQRTVQARQLAEIQWKKADAERQRYRLGRSTAFQVIGFEQDAAESEIALWNLHAAYRKTEAQARLFAR